MLREQTCSRCGVSVTADQTHHELIDGRWHCASCYPFEGLSRTVHAFTKVSDCRRAPGKIEVQGGPKCAEKNASSDVSSSPSVVSSARPSSFSSSSSSSQRTSSTGLCSGLVLDSAFSVPSSSLSTPLDECPEVDALARVLEALRQMPPERCQCYKSLPKCSSNCSQAEYLIECEIAKLRGGSPPPPVTAHRWRKP
jgi:ribosomal protein S27AE